MTLRFTAYIHRPHRGAGMDKLLYALVFTVVFMAGYVVVAVLLAGG